MATKAVKGHALVNRTDDGQWQCQCGVVYETANGDARMSRETARERHRVHLAQVSGHVATETPQSHDQG